MLGGIAIASVAQFIGICFMPESPRWLGKEGKSEQQRKVMALIYKPEFMEQANRELDEEVRTLK